MRLFHIDLIPKLPRQQLLGQHREACALRGNGWGKPHATVNYAFRYPPSKLYSYHAMVIGEMMQRGYRIEKAWHDPLYRGKSCLPWSPAEFGRDYDPHYPEHNDEYLRECIENLAAKGVIIPR